MKFGLILILVLTSTTFSCCYEIQGKAKTGENVPLECGSVSGEISTLQWTRDDLAEDKYVFLSQDNKVNEGAIDQRFKGRVTLKDPQTADIILKNVTVNDTGIYKCLVVVEGNQLPKGAVKLMVTDGAASKPSVTSLKATKDQSLLQCEVLGASPKPRVEWQDSSGNILPAEEPQVSEREGSYNIILQTNVTKSDHYSCVVTQETINHQTRAEINVYICGGYGGDGGISDLVTAAVFAGLGVVVAAVGVFLVVGHWRQRDIPVVNMKVESEVVRAKPGEDVTLKGVSVSGKISQLKWTRDDLDDDKYVFFYKDNKRNERVIDQRFKDRVTWKDPKTADIVLKNVTVSDTGYYKCWVYGENQHQKEDFHPHKYFVLIVTDGIQVVEVVKAEPGENVPLKRDSV